MSRQKAKTNSKVQDLEVKNNHEDFTSNGFPTKKHTIRHPRLCTQVIKKKLPLTGGDSSEEHVLIDKSCVKSLFHKKCETL